MIQWLRQSFQVRFHLSWIKMLISQIASLFSSTPNFLSTAMSGFMRGTVYTIFWHWLWEHCPLTHTVPLYFLQPSPVTGHPADTLPSLQLAFCSLSRLGQIPEECLADLSYFHKPHWGLTLTLVCSWSHTKLSVPQSSLQSHLASLWLQLMPLVKIPNQKYQSIPHTQSNSGMGNKVPAHPPAWPDSASKSILMWLSLAAVQDKHLSHSQMESGVY